MKKILMFSVFSFMIVSFSKDLIFENNVSSSGHDQTTFYNSSNYIIFPGTKLQIETSAFTHPENPDIIVASAITDYYSGGYTTGFYISTNRGQNWSGSDNIKNASGAIITTVGDPGIVINRNGFFVMNYIAPSPTAGYDLKVGVSYSTNNGSNWSSAIYIPGVDTADKPVIAVDNIPGSPYSGNIYSAYDELYNFGEETKGIYFSYSTNNGLSWDSSKKITNVDPDFKNRLIGNISVGLNGDVFVF